jgi:hypothetical protein
MVLRLSPRSDKQISDSSQGQVILGLTTKSLGGRCKHMSLQGIGKLWNLEKRPFFALLAGSLLFLSGCSVSGNDMKTEVLSALGECVKVTEQDFRWTEEGTVQLFEGKYPDSQGADEATEVEVKFEYRSVESTVPVGIYVWLEATSEQGVVDCVSQGILGQPSSELRMSSFEIEPYNPRLGGMNWAERDLTSIDFWSDDLKDWESPWTFSRYPGWSEESIYWWAGWGSFAD